MESIIYNKFGQLGARIVRILLDKLLVEDKQVLAPLMAQPILFVRARPTLFILILVLVKSMGMGGS